VAPLIPDSVGPLVFDKEMKAWVRKPRDTTTSSPSHFGSIHTSEEDPFSDIPDLTIDADEEARRLLRAQFTAQEVDASTILKRHMEKGPTPENESRQNNNPQFNEASSVSATGLELDQNCPKRSAVHDTEGDALERSVILPRENVNEAEGDITELNEQAEPVISSPPSSSQSILVHSTARAQQEEDSLVPMNPIQHSLANSNVQIPSQEARPDTNSTISMGVNQKHTYESQSDMQNQFWMPNSVRTNATKDHKPAIPSPLRSDKTLTSSSKKPTMFSPDHNQNIRDTLPRTVQFSTAVAEYSASDIKPSSLDSPDSPSALNISSVALISSPFNKQHSKPPLITLAPPPDRSVNLMPTTLAPSSSPAPHHSTFLLSELSEFTVNQIDERELPTRALIKRHSGETVYENRFAWGDHLLIMALQNIYGSELFWEDLQEVDLQGQKLTSLNGLELVCPNVLELNVNDNELANLQGCPPSVINIMAANNRLTNISYFDMAQNLRILDVSNNHLTSLTPFNSLPNLQILKADDNQLKDINGLYNASMHLKELSLRRNRFFGKLEFQINAEELMPLKHLEQLDLSDNEISSISGIEHLASLKALKLSGNELKSFVLEYPLGSEPPLRELDISKNELTLFTIKGQTSNLFNLDISDNKLSANKIEIQYATFVQCFNVRKQTGSMDGFKPFVDKHSRINMLLMGSNKFSVLEPQEPFQNVQALDIANCKLSQFQPNLQRIFPHLVTLNASFNHIKDLEPLSRYEALETLLLAGNAITRLRASCNVARSCSNLRAVDFRQNPVTDGFYRENKSIVAPSTMTAASANAMAISRTAALSTLSVTQPAKIPPPTNSISMQPPPPPLPSSSSTTSSSSAAATEAQQLALQLAIVTSDSHGLPPQALDRQRDDDAQHVRSLESSLRARRRCWDLLLPARLVLADGLWRSGEFRRLVSGDDELFRRLVALAVVKRSVAWRREEEDGLRVVSGRDE
jgi:Leucine-rich repeat (LRR) protein